MNHFLRIFTLIVLFSSPLTARAEDDVICIAGGIEAKIFPCDTETGKLLPAYSDPAGGCYKKFADICTTYQASLRKSCADSSVELAKQVDELTQKNEALLKQVRRLKRLNKNKR